MLQTGVLHQIAALRSGVNRQSAPSASLITWRCSKSKSFSTSPAVPFNSSPSMFTSSFPLVALFALPVFGAPSSLNTRAPYQDYCSHSGNGGTRTGVTGLWEGEFHCSGFLSFGGCSSTASIDHCFAAELLGDPVKMIVSRDAPPYVVGGTGTNQRALVIGVPHTNVSGVVTHTARFHISSAYNDIPPNFTNSVEIMSVRNADPTVGLKSLSLKVREWMGEDLGGITGIYVSVIDQQGREQYPENYILSTAVGKTVEVTFKLGVDGATVDPQGIYTAIVSAKFVATGVKLFETGVTKQLAPKGHISNGKEHALVMGPERRVTSSPEFKFLKMWFGDATFTQS